jgi:hypothetical protein
MNRRLLVSALACCAVAVPSGALAGSGGSYQEAKLKFTKERPGASTGMRVHIDYRDPADPDAKPPAVRRVVLKLARGARIDTLAPEWCTASDAELMATGADACSPGSKLGGGDVTVDTGFPGPGRFVDAHIDFLNNDHELIYVNTVEATTARTIIRAAVRRRRIITDAGMLPGTPPDGGAIDTVETFIPALSRTVDGQRRRYVRTPRHCPERGFWINRITFTYANGVTQTTRNHSRCEAA